MNENDYIPHVLQFDNIHSLYMDVKPEYENINKINQYDYLMDIMDKVESIQNIINTSVMKLFIS